MESLEIVKAKLMDEVGAYTYLLALESKRDFSVKRDKARHHILILLRKKEELLSHIELLEKGE